MDDHGPFDIIGDVHGCATELEDLLDRLGYLRDTPSADIAFHHPHGRTAIFVGDLADKGPRVVDALTIVMTMCRAGSALCVAGNRDEKLLERLASRGRGVTHTVDPTVRAVDDGPPGFRASVRAFLADLATHYVLDGGRLVITHEGVHKTLPPHVTVVHGHTPVPQPEWLGNALDIDTGCVYGGRLTAFRWPERTLVSVAARETYAVRRRGFRPGA